MMATRPAVFIFIGCCCALATAPCHAAPAAQDQPSTADIAQFRLASLWPAAQPQQPQTPLPAVVRVIAVDGGTMLGSGTMMSMGSGTLVDSNDDYGLVITNWHVVRDAVGPIEVVFPSGFHSMARVVRTD